MTIVCWIKGHDWTTFEIVDTTAPKGEHCIICLRCGEETTREALERERIAQAEAIYEYMQRRSRYY